MRNGKRKEGTCTVTVKDTEKKTTVPSTEAPTQAVKQESRDRYPTAHYYNYDNDFILPDSSIRKLNANEVMGLGSELAQDAINEIYARHGYVFKRILSVITTKAKAGIMKTTISAKATFRRLSHII